MWYFEELQVSEDNFIKHNTHYSQNTIRIKIYLSSSIYLLSSLAPTFGGQDIDPAVAIPSVSSRIAKRRASDIEAGLGLGRSQVIKQLTDCVND